MARRTPAGPRPGPEALRSAGAAFGLGWRAGRAPLAAFAAASVVSGLLPTVAALLVRQLFDALTRGAHGAAPAWWATLLALTGLATVLAAPLTEYARGQCARRVRLTVQAELFDSVNRLPGLRPFEDPAFQDRLRLAQQAGANAPDLLIGSAVSSLQSLVTLVGFLATVAVVNPVLGAASVLLTAPALGSQLAAGRRRAQVMADTMPRSRRQMFYASLLSSTDAVKEIRLFGLQRFFRDRAGQELGAVTATERRTELVNLARRLPATLLGVGVYAAGLLWAVAAARAGRLSVGDVSVFLAATAGVQTGVSQLASTASTAYQACLVFGHYRRLRSVAPDLPLAATPRPVPGLVGRIEFADVWFRYTDSSPWILRGLRLTLTAGQVTALVGLNGAGKSTLVKLLCRLYDPTRGAVLWDGVDVREFSPDELRSKIAAVFQDYTRYDLTAQENVGLGRLAELDDPEAVARAARAAGIHDRISALGQGYRTLLSRIFVPAGAPGGDGAGRAQTAVGESLSGGEWQRVAVARAFMRRDADLMILDEPSSGLDAAAEQEVHESLRELRRGATGLLVSHRLSTVREADRIVVLAAGQVAESGTHAELMALGGEYARLFLLQAEGYRAEAGV